MLTAYATVLFFALVAAAFVLGSNLAARLARTGDEAPGEGDEGHEETARRGAPFDPRLVLVAIVFLVFDVEVAFLLPVAVVFKRWVAQGHGARAAGEIFAFVGVLLVGLAYAWKKGDFDASSAP